jgi:hypothetical protein
MDLPVGSSREIEGNRSSTVALVSRRYNAREGIFHMLDYPDFSMNVYADDRRSQ